MALAVFFLLIAMLATELALIGLLEAGWIAVPSLMLSAGLLLRLRRRRRAHPGAHTPRHLPVY